MIALFLIIVAAIIFAPIIKAVGKAGIYLMLILIGVGWIGSQFGGSSSTTAPATETVTTAIATATPAPAQAAQTPEPEATPAPTPLSAEDQTFVDNGGHWIKTDTWGGRSKEDLNELINMALSDDTTAQAGMVREGRAVVLKQGQRVQLQEVAIFGGMEKVRPVGETKSWWINLSHSSKTPVMTQEEKLSAVEATTPGIAQKPLTGNLSTVKLFLGQPLTAWKKAYPSSKPSINNPSAYFFNTGRFLISVVFDEKSGLGNEVQISEANGKAPLTVKEATQIATSIGLSKPPVKDVEDPKTLNWNKEGDPLFAHFGTDKDDLILWIIVKPLPDKATSDRGLTQNDSSSLISTSGDRAEDQGLETFRLVGYNCSILVPKSIFPDPPVTEGKHTAFWSPDRKTKLGVFVQPQNSIPIAQAYRTYVAAGNLQPDYEVVRTNWFVVSGDKNGRGYYVKCVARNNLLLYMTLDYDEETFPFSDATLTAMSRNFLGK